MLSSPLPRAIRLSLGETEATATTRYRNSTAAKAKSPVDRKTTFHPETMPSAIS